MSIQFKKVTWYSKLLAIIVLFIVVPIVSFYLGNYYQETKIIIQNISASRSLENGTSTGSILDSTSTSVITGKPFQPLKGVICTMEAKQCPDGSYVGRTGPNCEFALCPKVK
ncbi:MAG: hypothetical protein WCV55_02395 [Candidatus Paceibacterota bacterium]